MKRWLTIFLVGIFSLFLYGEAEAAVAIDWWGLWGGNIEEIGAPFYGEGFVDGGTLFTGPLFVNGQAATVENAYYTWSATDLTVESVDWESYPGLLQVGFNGGAIDLYYDSDPYDIGGSSETQDWTNPRTTSQFTDGQLILSADFTEFSILWNLFTNMGYAYYEMTFTGGDWLNKLPGTSGFGGAFGSQLFIDPTLSPAYAVDSDGSVTVIPEPSTLILLGTGLAGLARMRKKNRHRGTKAQRHKATQL